MEHLRVEDFKFRAFKYNDVAQNMNLQQAGYTANMPSRTEQSAVIASGLGAKTVTFTHPFLLERLHLAIKITFYPLLIFQFKIWQQVITLNLVIYLELAGFTVHFKNSSNASINRNFTYSAVGFGKGG